MRILTLTNTALDPCLGSGKTVLAFSEGLRRFGHSVDIFSPADFEVRSQSARGKKFRQALGAFRLMARRLRRKSYDLVECYGDEFWLALLWLRVRQRRPVLVAHTNGFEPLAAEREALAGNRAQDRAAHKVMLRSLHSRFSRWGFQAADYLVCLSEADRNAAIGLGLFAREATAVIAPGLDPEFLMRPCSPAKTKAVAFTGSWIERKGKGVLAEALTSVLRADPEVEFHVFGAASEAGAVKADFPPEIRRRVVVHEKLATPALVQALSACSIFVFPGCYEGFGIALAEALACSCAAVCTATGFGAELRSGEEAVRVNFQDAEGLANAIFALLGDPERRCQIAAEGWKRVRALRWEHSQQDLHAQFMAWTAGELQTARVNAPKATLAEAT